MPKSMSTFAACIALLGCDAERSTNLRGSLVAFNPGGLIRELDLARREVLREQSVGSGPGNIARIDSSRYAVDYCENSGECGISIVDRSGEIQFSIENAVNPLFVPERQVLVYFRMGSSDEGWSLVAAPVVSPQSPTIVLLKVQKSPRSLPIISVGGAVVAAVDDSYQLLTINLDSQKTETHDLMDIAPRAWIPGTSRVIGYNRRNRELVLVDLESDSSSPIDVRNPDWGLVYLPALDGILFSRSRSKWVVAESADLFFFSLSSESESLVLKGFGMSSGFWLE